MQNYAGTKADWEHKDVLHLQGLPSPPLQEDVAFTDRRTVAMFPDRDLFCPDEIISLATFNVTNLHGYMKVTCVRKMYFKIPINFSLFCPWQIYQGPINLLQNSTPSLP